MNQELSVLEEITGAMIASADLSSLAHLILDLAVRHVHAEKGSLMLIDERRELSILCSRGLARNLARTYRIKLGEGIAGIVAARGKAVLCRDIRTDERFKEVRNDRYKTFSFISCPIIGRDGVLGVLNVNDKKNARPFTDQEFHLLRVLASLASMALEKNLQSREFKLKTVELEEANRKLVALDVSKSEFLTRLSHELRTPLNAIKGAVHVLQTAEGEASDLRSEFQEIIAGETEKILQMVNRQLDFLRLEDEGRILKKAFFPLETLLQEVSESTLVRNALALKHLDLEVELPGDLDHVVGDRILVGQMLGHLFEGIASLLTRPGRLRLSVRETEVVTVVLQASEKIPQAVMEGIFTTRNIYRADRVDKHIRLYLAIKIVEGHGWRLEVLNAREGFRLSVVIPRGRILRRETALNMTMDRMLGFVSELMGVDTCSLMLCDDLTGDLAIRSARGLDEQIVQNTRIRVGDRIAGWVAQEGKPLLIDDIETDPQFSRKNIDGQYRSRSLLSLPLKRNGQVVGVLNLNNKKNEGSFTDQDLRLATALGERISLLVGKVYSCFEREGDVREMLASLDNLLAAESRYDKKTSRHAELVGGIMTQLGASEADKSLALYVSQIYDLGLMLIDQRLLNKKGKLSTIETKAIKNHPLTTLDLLDSVEFSAEVEQAILHHHERYDGQGFPDQLRGEAIPLLSRVLAVVDAFCALTEARPYRSARSYAEALQEIRSAAGRLYDPKIVQALELQLLG